MLYKIQQLLNRKYNMTQFKCKSNKNRDKKFDKAFIYKKIDFFILFMFKWQILSHIFQNIY